MKGQIFKSLFSQKLNMDGCDLESGGRRSAHRLILSAASGYFCGIFNSPFVEQNSETITLSLINFETLESMISFFYTEEWTFSEKCTPAMAIVAADYLLADCAVDSLSDYVREHIGTLNVIEVYCLGDKISKHAKDILAEYISLHIDTLDELPILSSSQILYILKMHPGEPKKTLTAIKKWVLAIPDERHRFAFELLSCVVIKHGIQVQFIMTEIVPICKCDKSWGFAVALLARMLKYSDAFVEQHLFRRN